MTDITHSRTVVCRLDELGDPDSRGMTVTHGGQVFGYRNSCPHTGGPLDWVPDRFLNLDKDYIQCATHDALFRLHNGACVAGPCKGDSLVAVPVIIEAGEVVMLTDALDQS